MIPTLIFLYVRRYMREHPDALRSFLHLSVKIIVLVALSFICITSSLAQSRLLMYDVLRDGKNAGTLQVQCTMQQNKMLYRLESKVKVRMLLSFTAESFEETRFENGMLVYSSLYRKLNGTEKNNKKMFITPAGYEVQNGGKKEMLNFTRIDENTLTLYHKEPLGVQKIYSDNYQQYLTVHKVGEHRYQLYFPDGSWSEYWYNNGICIAVYVNSSWFSFIMQLKN